LSSSFANRAHARAYLYLSFSENGVDVRWPQNAHALALQYGCYRTQNDFTVTPWIFAIRRRL